MSALPLRILVLEDHLFQRTVAVNMLLQLGCQEVLSAANGAEAINMLQHEGAVDIVLCDLHMEGMDGLEFLQRAARRGLVSSVIINSTFTEEIRRAARQLVPLLGLRLIGDLDKPLHKARLAKLLEAQLSPEPETRSKHPLLKSDVEEMRSALSNRQLHTYFQPKVQLACGEVMGVEALSRWHHPSSGVVSPAVFMPTLEAHHLLDDLFFEQFEHGLNLQHEVLRQGRLLNVAFNLQAIQLGDPTLVSRVRSTLASHGLPASGITFELTENGLLEPSATCLESLIRLRMMGCRLSIDDFGIGFSSLQRLCQLPFTEIKLDGEFVRGLHSEPRRRAAIKSTLALGQTLGMTVVAEGIETQAQYQQLLELGCRQGQGYLFARPMASQDLLDWLNTRGSPVP